MNRYLKHVIQILGEVPQPPKYVYHVTPYANEILSSGFEIKPARQTFGGHGTYVSVTTLENARKYSEDLRLIVGFLNLELTWEDLEIALTKRGLGRALTESLSNRMYNSLLSTSYRYKDPFGNMTDEQRSSWKKYLPKGLDEDFSPRVPAWYAWIKELAFSQLDFDNSPLEVEEELSRRWEVLHGLWAYSPNDNQFTLLVSSGLPYHLLNRDMSDVQILEIETSPVEAASESGYAGVPKEPKGKFTYNPSEKEWRFYDPTDLKPVRIVE